MLYSVILLDAAGGVLESPVHQQGYNLKRMKPQNRFSSSNLKWINTQNSFSSKKTALCTRKNKVLILQRYYQQPLQHLLFLFISFLPYLCLFYYISFRLLRNFSVPKSCSSYCNPWMHLKAADTDLFFTLLSQVSSLDHLKWYHSNTLKRNSDLLVT